MSVDPRRTCQVEGILDGLSRLTAAGLDVARTTALVCELLDTEHVCYTFGSTRPDLDGVNIEAATVVNLAAELDARTRAIRNDLQTESPPDLSHALTFLAEPISATAYLIEIMRPAEHFGSAMARALDAGDGNLDAGVWALRSAST
jgi:hypothetical protein